MTPPLSFYASNPTNGSDSNVFNHAKLPHSSSSSPSSKKVQPSRFSNNHTPLLPSYPPLPPSNNRSSSHIATSSSGSSSSADASRSLPSSDANHSKDPRARRRARVRLSNPLPTNEKQKNLNFLSNLSQNDTLQRRKRDQQINNHVKQYQHISSDDEHEVLSKANPAQPVCINLFLSIIFILFGLLYC